MTSYNWEFKNQKKSGGHEKNWNTPLIPFLLETLLKRAKIALSWQ